MILEIIIWKKFNERVSLSGNLPLLRAVGCPNSMRNRKYLCETYHFPISETNNRHNMFFISKYKSSIHHRSLLAISLSCTHVFFIVHMPTLDIAFIDSNKKYFSSSWYVEIRPGLVAMNIKKRILAANLISYTSFLRLIWWRNKMTNSTKTFFVSLTLADIIRSVISVYKKSIYQNPESGVKCSLISFHKLWKIKCKKFRLYTCASPSSSRLGA